MIEIVKNFPDPMLMEPQELCVSIYQPARPGSMELSADQVTYRNMLRELEEQLSERMDKREVQKWLSPLEEIKEDKGFWQDSIGGMALFASSERAIVYRFPGETLPFLSVGDTFLISPLIKKRIDMPFYLLGLSLTDFWIYKGNQEGLTEVLLPEGTPRTLEEVLGDQHTEGFLTHGRYAGPGGGGGSIFHGQGAKKDEAMIDLEKYFRYVDKIVSDEIVSKDPLPVILISLTEHQGEFRKLSSNPHLHNQGVPEAFDVIKLDQQAELARRILAGEADSGLKSLIEMLPGEMAKGLASDDPVEIRRAAEEGRIRTLLLGELQDNYKELTEDRQETIRLRERTAEDTLKRGGEVLVADGGNITERSDMGAVFRY